MDPRVTISQGSLQEQYRLARRLAALMDRSYAQATAAKVVGNAKAAAAFSTENDEAGFLLETIDGADAPPTQQAVEALRALEGRKAAQP
jgi:hypothetical protein